MDKVNSIEPLLQREVPEQYLELIRIVEEERIRTFEVITDPFMLMAYWEEHTEWMRQVRGDERNRLFGSLRGKTLIDFGGSKGREVRNFAENLGVHLLVNVDPTHSKQELGTIFRCDLHYQKYLGDMLTVASKLPNASVNVVINGIDSNIITEIEYHRAMAAEIARITEPGGLVFGDRSTALSYLDETTFNKDEYRWADIFVKR